MLEPQGRWMALLRPLVIGLVAGATLTWLLDPVSKDMALVIVIAICVLIAGWVVLTFKNANLVISDINAELNLLQRMRDDVDPFEVDPECGCARCRVEWSAATGIGFGYPMMILCSSCGNKRCPHATDHRNECTHSNEPGQPGSSYA